MSSGKVACTVCFEEVEVVFEATDEALVDAAAGATEAEVGASAKNDEVEVVEGLAKSQGCAHPSLHRLLQCLESYGNVQFLSDCGLDFKKKHRTHHDPTDFKTTLAFQN